MDKIFLIDGHAQVFRMYYAFMTRPLINSKGVNTSILYGFTKMVLELINKEHPTHIAVTFDSHVKTFRHKIFPEYKANRPPTPELVIESLPPLKEILQAMRIPVIMVEGVEADDVIGTMAKSWADDNTRVYLVTPDKDFGQLLQSNIFQYKLTKGGSAEAQIIGAGDLCAKYNIQKPEQVVDILSIWGDAADNVPGVKGVGEVGAKKLISKYGSVEGLLDHIGELPENMQQKIKNAEQMLKMSKFLVTIKTDVEIPVTRQDITIQVSADRVTNEVFEKYEFRTLKKLLPKVEPEQQAQLQQQQQQAQQQTHQQAEDESYMWPEPATDIPSDTPQEQQPSEQEPMPSPLESVADGPDVTVEDAEIEQIIQEAAKAGELVVEMPVEGALILTIAIEEKANAESSVEGCAKEHITAKRFLCKELSKIKSNPDYLLIKKLLEDSSIAKIGCNIKLAINKLRQQGKIICKGELYDIQLMHYLVNPELSHTSDFIIQSTLNIDTVKLGADYSDDEEKDAPFDLFAMAKKQENRENKIEGKSIECALYQRVKHTLLNTLKEQKGEQLYNSVEMPLIQVLSDMELQGVKIDTEHLAQYSKILTKQMEEIEAKAKELAQTPQVNLSSPKQVGILLFEKLKIVDDMKQSVRGNYPTDEQTLKTLADKHPIIEEILEYRNLKKLLSTYIDALPMIISRKDGKLHTTFNQALTATGRLSSTNPNLQNIPVRTERGKEIRKAFVPSDENGYIVSADYSQIELRLMAHFSQDAHLIEAFNSGKDVHTATAAKLFNTDIESVTEAQRRKAKTVNFGIIYGISPFGLAERMDIGVKEAKEFIESYFKNYPSVKAYIEETIERAKITGYVETLYGRRRYLSGINSRNNTVRKFNERNAINAPLQGSAADIIKIAMVNVWKRLKKQALKSKMILQVHDELVFDVVAGEKEIIMEIAKQEMESVADLNVKLIADCNYGKNWLESH